MTKPLAVVTGASKGIGRAIAVRLARDFDILALARTKAALDELAMQIEGAGGRCTTAVVDVADPAAVAGALKDVDAEVLVNNAGVGPIKPMLELTPDEWNAIVDVNFNGLYHVT